MLLSDFDFELPESLIATHPLEPRDAANLMVTNRASGKIIHSQFSELTLFLKKGDFLVFNKTKVIPARLFGEAVGFVAEILLIKQIGSSTWEVIGKPGRKLKPSLEIKFSDRLKGKIKATEKGKIEIDFNLKSEELWKEINRIGEMPLPPYILKERREKHDEKSDKKDYQTVFADKSGSVAAPTAGLHFTKSLLKEIQEKGCQVGFVDLHVGLGTFEPIWTENIEDHKIHSEYFELTDELAKKLNMAKKEGRRIVAVGTTTVRVLETCAKNGLLVGKSGETDIYIYPGYRFKFVDAMITNFHLPKSSLLLLVSAFWTKEKMLKTYNEAIKKNYRFYSYGDGMFIT